MQFLRELPGSMTEALLDRLQDFLDSDIPKPPQGQRVVTTSLTDRVEFGEELSILSFPNVAVKLSPH
jgi:hypothetical protein